MRFINKYIDPEREVPVPINELIENHQDKTIFTTTDMTLGYYQIPLDKESRKYTAFVFDGKVYQFRRVPFGLKTAGNAFVRAMNKAIQPHTTPYATEYVDDTLIGSTTFDEHIQHLDDYLQRMARAGFTINFERCNFCEPEIDYLGFYISGHF